MTLAFVFPGQGSQAPGMAKAVADAFPAAAAVLEEVDEALGQKLSTLMFDGPQEDLTLTENAQPALMAASLAVMAALKAEFGVDVSAAAYAAGHSLGEYSALAAAGAISVTDAARLLKRRGEAMQNAVPVGDGAMAALLGADMAQARAACDAGAMFGVCEIANDNAPGQVVIAGAAAAVEAAAGQTKDLGIKKAMMLAVSAPFHCRLMQPAADEMAQALAATPLASPRVPIVANVTARPVTDPERIRALLVEQVTAAVRWRESVEWLAAPRQAVDGSKAAPGEAAGGGVTTFVEVGAGKVLTQMLKRTAPDARGVALNTPEDLDAFAKEGAVAG